MCKISRINSEREFFDRIAEEHKAEAYKPISRSNLERYRLTKNARYFMKEKMFELVNKFPGKKLLEVGCGEGISSIQLTYAGKDVTAFDISPVSIEVAKLRAAATGVQVDFRVGDAVEQKFNEKFDIIWFQLVLHHLVEPLDSVMKAAYDSLKPGGLFVSCEPVAYWKPLKFFSRFVPGNRRFTPDECPLRHSEFEIIRRYFPNLQMRYYRLFGRSDMFTRNLAFIKFTAMIDNALFIFPGVKHLADSVVMWATK